jgi:arylsulfatase
MPRLLASLFLTFGLFLANASASGAQGAVHASGHTQESRRPNFVFILVDDQDLHLNSLDYMPNLQRLIGDQGTVFERHFCTIAVCCPSRVSLMTGKLAHNTNVTDVSPPYGMAGDFSPRRFIT